MPLIIPDALPLPIVATDEVIVHRGALSYVTPATNVVAAPGLARYIGLTTGNPTIALDNFRFRFDTATLNLQIATVAGTETINAYTDVSWGSGNNGADGYNYNLAVTTAFATLGDVGALFQAEWRNYIITPSNTADVRAYKFEYAGWDNGANRKIIMRLSSF